jgi:hypothetical protein
MSALSVFVKLSEPVSGADALALSVSMVVQLLPPFRVYSSVHEELALASAPTSGMLAFASPATSHDTCRWRLLIVPTGADSKLLHRAERVRESLSPMPAESDAVTLVAVAACPDTDMLVTALDPPRFGFVVVCGCNIEVGITS